ncbi:MAG: hypothetical protein NVSMB68_15680 [Thermoanaerobaculia bacterium]
MAISLLQKLRLALRGWSRRREQKEQDFLRTNTKWGGGGQAIQPAAEPPRTGTIAGPPPTGRIACPPQTIDVEGLQAAYLDSSGRIAYYLDVHSGDVVESRDGATFDATRFKRVPVRTSEDDDRRAFIETLEPSDIRMALMRSVAAPDFRSVLASNRTVERAWYNFKNSRATASIESWLAQLGLR